MIHCNVSTHPGEKGKRRGNGGSWGPFGTGLDIGSADDSRRVMTWEAGGRGGEQGNRLETVSG